MTFFNFYFFFYETTNYNSTSLHIFKLEAFFTAEENAEMNTFRDPQRKKTNKDSALSLRNFSRYN
jgi:hypothetical protein